MGYIGSSLASVNSGRSVESRRERLAIETELKEAEARRLYDQQAPERERAAQQAEHERRELKKRLLLDKEESADFTRYKSYDGRFPDAASVEKAIRESWALFLEHHDLDSQAKNTVTMFLQLHPWADVTLPETFENALAYLESRLCPAEAPVSLAPVSVQTTPVIAPDRYESTRQEIADLRAKAEKCAFDSKERNDLERRAYQLEVKLEVLGNDDYQTVMQEIVEQSGKALSGAHSLQFRQWLASPVQSRRYGSNTTDIRLAFAEWSGSSEWLDPQEQAEIQRRANISNYSSDDIKNIVGSRNTYDPSNDAYQARRS